MDRNKAISAWFLGLHGLKREIVEFLDGFSWVVGLGLVAFALFPPNVTNIRANITANYTYYSGIYHYNGISYNFSYIISLYSPSCVVEIDNSIFIEGWNYRSANMLYRKIWNATYPNVTLDHLCIPPYN